MTNTCRTNFTAVETYMRSCMSDSAHDTEHVYRVLNYAIDIAKHDGGANTELLAVACLLHDIGREEQFADPSIDHAVCGDTVSGFAKAAGLTVGTNRRFSGVQVWQHLDRRF